MLIYFLYAVNVVLALKEYPYHNYFAGKCAEFWLHIIGIQPCTAAEIPDVRTDDIMCTCCVHIACALDRTRSI